MGDPPLQNPAPALPSGFNSTGGPPMQNIYGQAAGGPPFPNPNLMRPPAALTGPPGAIHPSPVEVYLQKHEVTATVCIPSSVALIQFFLQVKGWNPVHVYQSVWLLLGS